MRIVFGLYLIGIHLLLALVLWKSDFLQRVGFRLGWVSVWPHHERMMVYHRWMDPVIPDGSVIFIGDSITQSLPVCAVVPNGVNWGIGGDTTVGVLRRLREYRSLERAQAVVLAIGVNDLPWRSDEAILATWDEILAALPSGTPLLVSAMLPFDSRIWKGVGVDGTARRLHLNAEVKSRVAARGGQWVDASSRLEDETGCLQLGFHTGDGIHLSPEGYQVWIEALREAIAQLPHASQPEEVQP